MPRTQRKTPRYDKGKRYLAMTKEVKTRNNEIKFGDTLSSIMRMGPCWIVDHKLLRVAYYPSYPPSVLNWYPYNETSKKKISDFLHGNARNYLG